MSECASRIRGDAERRLGEAGPGGDRQRLHKHEEIGCKVTLQTQEMQAPAHTLDFPIKHSILTEGQLLQLGASGVGFDVQVEVVTRVPLIAKRVATTLDIDCAISSVESARSNRQTLG